jgi:hypothetical protein
MKKDNRPKLIPTPANIMRAGIKYAKGSDKLALMRAAAYFDSIGFKPISPNGVKCPWVASRVWRIRDNRFTNKERIEYAQIFKDRWDKYGDQTAYNIYEDNRLCSWSYFDPVTKLYYKFGYSQVWKQVRLPHDNGRIDSMSKVISQYIVKPRITKSSYKHSYRNNDIVVSYSQLKKRVLTMVEQNIDVRNLHIKASKYYADRYIRNAPDELEYATAVAFVDDPNKELILNTENSKIVSWVD